MVTATAAAGRHERYAAVRRWLSDEERLARASWLLLRLFALSIPFSIALAQTLLTLTAVVALRHAIVARIAWPRTPLDAPILAFLAAALLAAFVGLDPAQGLWGSRTYLQVILVYLVVAHVRSPDRARTLLACFLAGMVATSTHTVLAAILPVKLPNPFPGSMTESGQLLFALGFSAAFWMHGALWHGRIGMTTVLHGLALVANLKRGVWLGALATLTVLGGLRSRRLLVVTAAAVLAIVAVPEVRLRLEHTQRDLFLPGQRYDIWKAAVDVVGRFPMGIGRKNGTILRDYPNIARNHKHAHNNVLQITMEFGIAGLLAFAWWMAAWARLVWRARVHAPRGDPVRQALGLALLATFIGFHVAGLVEYNFGDTEVLQVVFLAMGLAAALDRMPPTPEEG